MKAKQTLREKAATHRAEIERRANLVLVDSFWSTTEQFLRYFVFVDMERGEWWCTCRGFGHAHTCWHVDAAKDAVKREATSV